MAGLMMAPQGIGTGVHHALGRQRHRPRRAPRKVVPYGILLMAAATMPFAFVTSSTSGRARSPPPSSSAASGLGLTMMPVTCSRVLRPQSRGDPQGLHHHEHHAPGGRLRGHRALRRGARTPDRLQPRCRWPASPVAPQPSSARPERTRPRRQSGRRGLRPNVLVVGRAPSSSPSSLPCSFPTAPPRRRPADGPAARTGRAPTGAEQGPVSPARCSTDARRPHREHVAGLGGQARPSRVRRRGRGGSELVAAAGGDPPRSGAGRAAPRRRAPGLDHGPVRLRRPRRAGRPRGLRPALAEPRAGATRRGPAPRHGHAIDLCTGSGALAVALRRPAPGRPRRRHRPTRAPWPAPGPTASRRTPGTSSTRAAGGWRHGRRGGRRRALRAHACARLLPRDTLHFEDAAHYDGGPDGTDSCARVVAEARGSSVPGGALLLELGGDQAELLRPALGAARVRGRRDLGRRGRRPAGPGGHRPGRPCRRRALSAGRTPRPPATGPPPATAGRGRGTPTEPCPAPTPHRRRGRPTRIGSGFVVSRHGEELGEHLALEEVGPPVDERGAVAGDRVVAPRVLSEDPARMRAQIVERLHRQRRRHGARPAPTARRG